MKFLMKTVLGLGFLLSGFSGFAAESCPYQTQQNTKSSVKDEHLLNLYTELVGPIKSDGPQRKAKGSTEVFYSARLKGGTTITVTKIEKYTGVSQITGEVKQGFMGRSRPLDQRVAAQYFDILMVRYDKEQRYR